jgi:hypothetical protein
MATANTSKTKTETKLNIDPETPARVVEKQGDKTITYEAKVETVESEVNPNGESGDFEGEDFINSEYDFEEAQIPKTQLERMFDDLRYAIERQSIDDQFYASVIRMPDQIGGAKMRFPCATQMDLGVFGFRSTDMFGFPKAVQERNRNSGGVFNIRIYDGQQKPLVIWRQVYGSNKGVSKEIGLFNYSVTDPVLEDVPNVNGQPNNSNIDLINLITENQKQSDLRFEKLLETINKPKEKSTLEAAIEQKVLNDILNPPQPVNGNDQFQQTLQQTMASMFAMPRIINGFADQMFPTPTPPEKRDTFDRVLEALKHPMIEGVIERVGDIGETIVVQQLQKQANSVNQAQQNPADPTTVTGEIINDQQQPEESEMQELTNDLITELESGNKLDKDNKFLQDLETDYPDAAEQIKTLCQNMKFEGVQKMLVGELAKLNPSPIVPFFDVDATNASGKYVYNERGQKLMIRLKEFYDYVNTLES